MLGVQRVIYSIPTRRAPKGAMSAEQCALSPLAAAECGWVGGDNRRFPMLRVKSGNGGAVASSLSSLPSKSQKNTSSFVHPHSNSYSVDGEEDVTEDLDDLPPTIDVPMWRTDAIVDRKSEFVAHAVAIDRAAEAVPFILGFFSEDCPLTADCIHPAMFAFRAPGRNNNSSSSSGSSSGRGGVAEEGSGDDGESGAGRRLLQVVRRIDVDSEGAAGALVVVSRWYGGSNIGSARFRHLQTSAEAALEALLREGR